MAYVLGKDLDAWEDSVATTEPYMMTGDEKIGAQYMTGADLMRSAKIGPEWKKPVALYAQAYRPLYISGQISRSLLTGFEDEVHDLGYNIENTVAQRAVELLTQKESDKSTLAKLWEGTEFGKVEKTASSLLSLGVVVPGLNEESKIIREKAKTYDEMVDLLKDREYPLTKYAQRVIADNTNHVENRRLVRELYKQSQGIDSSAWYNQGATILGAMIPAITATRLGYTGALMGGATRAGAVNTAMNIAKGVVGMQEAGRYAEETAAEYLRRTGDKTFEKFTAKDATGLGAIAYGAIAAEIEFMGGVEPVMAGALSKVGLRSGLARAGLKIGVGEATEEFLQGMTELLMRKMDGSVDKTWKDGILEALNGAVWGLFIGGLTGTPAFYMNRRNLVKGIKQVLPNLSDQQATQVADIMIDSVGETASQNQTLRQNLRDKISFMMETSDIANKEDRIDAITDLEYALIAADAGFDGIDIENHPLFHGEVNKLGWFRAGIPEESRAVVNDLLNELNDLETQLKTLNETKEKDWEKIDEIERKLEMFDRYVLDKLGENAPLNMRALEKELRKVEDRYVAKEKKKAGIPVDVIKTTQTSDHDYGNVIQEDVVEESKNGVKYWFITDRNGGGRIRLLTPENKIIGQININKNGVRYLYLEPEYRSDKYGKLLWDEAQRFTNPSEVMATGREDTPVERAIGFWKKQRFKQVGETPKMTRKIDKTKQLEPFPENQMSTAMFQEQFDLADENARLDDIYPAYEGDTIEVDGKERTVYNSNGERIAQSEPALRNFYKWFGDSKVVDEQGRPLVVYHGTNAEFSKFITDKEPTGDIVPPVLDNGVGAYFTSDKEKAAGFGKNVYSVYLSIKNPYMYQNISADERYYGKYSTYTEIQNAMIKDGYDGNFGYGNIVAFFPNQIKSVDNRGTFSENTPNIYRQNRASGGAPSTYRGAYIPQYRFIQRTNKMDSSTLSHELAHDWFEINFDKFRSGKASKEFMRAWGALEKALGITDKSTKAEKAKASEAFARAYEGWIMNNKGWEKLINIDDKDKDDVIKLMLDYQSDLRDIYQDLTNPYFKQTWGKLGEMKPEIKAWFDKVVNITDIDKLVERGEMTPEQASQEKLNQAIDTVIENTEDAETKKTLKTMRVLNDTQRYEAEGGNKNSLQVRLANLAKAIDENNMLIKENYDTHRDMLEVAKQADNFVKTRLEDALAIINGQMAEQEGLFKEDIYTALERLALENGDLNLLDELKNSEVANRLAKELGQRVAGFRNWNAGDMDIVSSLKALDNKFNKALQNKKAQAQMAEAEQMFAKAQEQQDKLADKELDSVLKDMECK